MKIAFASIDDPNDLHSWSGITSIMSQNLARNISDFEIWEPMGRPWHKIFGAKKLFYRFIANQNYFRDREPIVLKSIARNIMNRARRSNVDLIFSSGTLAPAFLESSFKFAFWADATFAGMINFYPAFSKLCKETIKEATFAEKRALDNCSLAFFSSSWAAKSAIEFYNVDSNKVHVVPFGANLESTYSANDVAIAADVKLKQPCRLLFPAVDWDRKGGDTAVETAKLLNNLGLVTELHVVGCHSSKNHSLPYVIQHGFISKRTPEGRHLLQNLFKSSTFVILPTKAECFGVVFPEAASFGVPSLAPDIGGVASAIKEGVSGWLLQPTSDARAYAKIILETFSNDRYPQICLSSFLEYKSNLNWTTSSEKVARILRASL